MAREDTTHDDHKQLKIQTKASNRTRPRPKEEEEVSGLTQVLDSWRQGSFLWKYFFFVEGRYRKSESSDKITSPYLIRGMSTYVLSLPERHRKSCTVSILDAMLAKYESYLERQSRAKINHPTNPSILPAADQQANSSRSRTQCTSVKEC